MPGTLREWFVRGTSAPVHLPNEPQDPHTSRIESNAPDAASLRCQHEQDERLSPEKIPGIFAISQARSAPFMCVTPSNAIHLQEHLLVVPQ